MNKVTLIGRLTKDVQVNPAGTVAKFTLAVNRIKKDDPADFINCIAFGKTGETIARYVKKGHQFAIAGNIRTGTYDAQDGTKRHTVDVVVESFDFINSNNSGGQAPTGNNNNFAEDMTPVDDGDMPF